MVAVTVSLVRGQFSEIRMIASTFVKKNQGSLCFGRDDLCLGSSLIPYSMV